jgi:hypothetical protein
LTGTQAPAVTVGGYDGTDGDLENDDNINGRPPRRAATGAAAKGGRNIDGYNTDDDMEDEADASEQDYGDDEEDDDIVSLASEGDEDEDEDEEDELGDDDVDMVDRELDELEDKKSLLVTLPVKTPTPEKPAIQLRLSPAKTPLVLGTTGSPEGRPTVKSPEIQMAGDGASTTTQQDSNASSSEAVTAAASGTTTTMNGQRDTPSQLPPTLAFRGSPEKPHSFPHPIHVGEGRP